MRARGALLFRKGPASLPASFRPTHRLECCERCCLKHRPAEKLSQPFFLLLPAAEDTVRRAKVLGPEQAAAKCFRFRKRPVLVDVLLGQSENVASWPSAFQKAFL